MCSRSTFITQSGCQLIPQLMTVDELKSNYLEKMQEVENIRDEYEQLSIDLRRFSSALRGKKKSQSS